VSTGPLPRNGLHNPFLLLIACIAGCLSSRCLVMRCSNPLKYSTLNISDYKILHRLQIPRYLYKKHRLRISRYSALNISVYKILHRLQITRYLYKKHRLQIPRYLYKKHRLRISRYSNRNIYAEDPKILYTTCIGSESQNTRSA
jgi:hypothetical protein